MACACGVLTITTGAIGTTFSVTGLSFTPTALLFNWSGRTGGVGDAEAGHNWGKGIAVSTTSRCAYATRADYPPTAMVTASGRWNDAVITTILPTSNAVDGKADLDAILSDGFRLIIDVVFTIPVEVQWFAWDATSAQIVEIDGPSTSGDQDVSTSFPLNTGLDDKCVIFLGYNFEFGVVQNTSQASFGIAAGNTIVQGVLAGSSENAATTSVTCGYCRLGECIATPFQDAIQNRASVTAWLSTGFRLNWAETSGIYNFSALVMKGGNRWTVGSALTSTGTTNQTEATGYQPKGLIVVSQGKAESAADTTQPHQEFSIGFATGPTTRSCMAMLDADAAATAEIARGFHTDCVYINYDEANAFKATIDGLMDLVSFDATPGFTYVMDDADAAANFFWYLLTADAGYSLIAEHGTYVLAGQAVDLVHTIPPPSATLSGTITADASESDIQTGGKTIVLTLTKATWIPE